MKYTATVRKTPPPQAFFRLYDEEDVEGEVRPGVLAEPRPQERVLQFIDKVFDVCCAGPAVLGCSR